MVNSTDEFPPGDTPSLALLHPTQDEKTATWRLNGSAWKGAMDIPTYLRRETHLENQAFTKDGGITFWVLVDSAAQPNVRPILASCESLRKRALIFKGDGEVEEIISHGIGKSLRSDEFQELRDLFQECALRGIHLRYGSSPLTHL
ncbi:hypothetical protein P7C71_g4154, partial [Lecanoromycetidae sp. Uapishka_2]